MAERVEMTCPCGATIKLESNTASVIKARMDEWLGAHLVHEAQPFPSVGIASTPLTVDMLKATEWHLSDDLPRGSS
jgi:hypothetical protein